MAAPTVTAGPNGLVVTATYPSATVEIPLGAAGQMRRVQNPPWARVAYVSFWDTSGGSAVAADGAVYQEGASLSLADNSPIPADAQPVPAGVSTPYEVAASRYDGDARSRVGSELCLGAFSVANAVARVEYRAVRSS